VLAGLSTRCKLNLKAKTEKKNEKEKENHVWQRLSWAFIPRIPIKLKCFLKKAFCLQFLRNIPIW
jgi:hypothetical protein